jgi:glucosamine 6-phosphate synthetase-like amidotransferase/phosphosugar isomerase protein
VLVSDQSAVAGGNGVSVFELPEAPAVAAPILQILPVQLLVDEVAGQRGLTIGELRRHQDDTKVS